MRRERNKAVLYTQWGNHFQEGSASVPKAVDLIQRAIREQSFGGTPHLGAGVIASQFLQRGWRFQLRPLSRAEQEIDSIEGDSALIMMSAIDMGVTVVEQILERHPSLEGRTIVGGQGISPIATEFSRSHPGIAVFEGRADQMGSILSWLEQGKEVEGVWRPPKSTDLSAYSEHPSLQEKYTYRRMEVFHRTRIKPVEAASGCARGCEICPAAREKVLVKPIEAVQKEIELTRMRKGDLLFFVDHDLFNLGRDYLRELFGYLNTRGILWAGEGTIFQVVDDKELLKIMAKNCVVFLAGLEDVSSNFRGPRVKTKLVQEFDRTLATLRRNKFPITWSMVFGLDEHTPETFLDTARFIEKHRLNVNLHLVQPRNGTRFQQQLLESDRMLTADSRYRDGVHLVYEPKSMTKEEALAGYIWLKGFVAKTARVRFINNLSLGGLRYAAALASIELAADGLTGWRMQKMYPELTPTIKAYDKAYEEQYHAKSWIMKPGATNTGRLPPTPKGSG